MKTLTIELTKQDSLKALQELERRRLIRIIKRADPDSYALPGDLINETDFMKWIEYIEESPTVSMSTARQQWVAQKKKLQKLIR